jgi:hypothetical protein
MARRFGSATAFKASLETHLRRPSNDHWGTFHYLQDPSGGTVIELISRIPRQ